MHALRWNCFVGKRAPSYGFAKFSHQLVYARKTVLMQWPQEDNPGADLFSRPWLLASCVVPILVTYFPSSLPN